MKPPIYPLRGALSVSRRSFLAGSAVFAAATLLPIRLRGAAVRQPKFSAYPFSLGVASGDPLSDGFVMWTRLAPKPLETGGGMTDPLVEVSWQVAEDEGMRRVVSRGVATADAAWGHSVHVEVEGLKPDRWYWYQFKAGSETSPVGRARTTPLVGAPAALLKFAVASCQKYQIGYYTAFEHMAREDIDLVVHLGDYIYEKDEKKGGGLRNVRDVELSEIFSIDDYRARYALYKSDTALQAAHAAAPWIVTWDDHEVSNDYANAIQEDPDKSTVEEFLQRRAAAYQAYYEHMPLRRAQLPAGPDMLLYRRLGYGDLVNFNVLDTRQYRTDQPVGEKVQPETPAMMDPRGTIMGDRQRRWLFDGLDASEARWNVLAQQVMVARVDLKAGEEQGYAADKWTGYEFERRRLLRHLQEHKTTNPVVLTGDIHSNWANEVAPDPTQPQRAAVATEFVGTSITSNGDGAERPPHTETLLAENPEVKFYNSERGYLKCEVSPTQWKTEYKTVPYVSRPGAPLNTRATFVVESGRAVLNRV